MVTRRRHGPRSPQLPSHSVAFSKPQSPSPTSIFPHPQHGENIEFRRAETNWPFLRHGWTPASSGAAEETVRTYRCRRKTCRGWRPGRSGHPAISNWQAGWQAWRRLEETQKRNGECLQEPSVQTQIPQNPSFHKQNSFFKRSCMCHAHSPPRFPSLQCISDIDAIRGTKCDVISLVTSPGPAPCGEPKPPS